MSIQILHYPARLFFKCYQEVLKIIVKHEPIPCTDKPGTTFGT